MNPPEPYSNTPPGARLFPRPGEVDYFEYLRSPEWAAVHRMALEQAEDRCRLCGSSDFLQVHHRTYDRLGRERLADVVVLCDRCHERFHASPIEIEQAAEMVGPLIGERRLLREQHADLLRDYEVLLADVNAQDAPLSIGPEEDARQQKIADEVFGLDPEAEGGPS